MRRYAQSSSCWLSARVAGWLLLGAIGGTSPAGAELYLRRVSLPAGAGVASAPPVSVMSSIGGVPAGRSTGGSWTLFAGSLIPSRETSSLGSLLPTTNALIGVGPNPISHSAMLGFQVYSQESFTDVRADLYDATGRLVRAVLREVLPSGGYQRRLVLDDGKGRLPNGVYLLRLRIGQDMFKARIVVVR